MQNRPIHPVVITAVIAVFTACTPQNRTPHYADGYYHSGIYFGRNLPPLFQRGIKDGCRTAKGVYTKSHRDFRQNPDYADGWFLGRNKCRHLLQIDENGDLVLE